MKIASRVLFVVACVISAASVLLAAYVAHQGEALSPWSLKSLQSALQMQQIHALASHDCQSKVEQVTQSAWITKVVKAGQKINPLV